MVNFVAAFHSGFTIHSKKSMTQENKINVVVSFTPDQMTIVSFEAQRLEMDVPTYLIYSAHKNGLFEQAIERGYDIFGRNNEGEVITQAEILYGDMVKPLEPESTETASKPLRLPTADVRKVRRIDDYRQK